MSELTYAEAADISRTLDDERLAIERSEKRLLVLKKQIPVATPTLLEKHSHELAFLFETTKAACWASPAIAANLRGYAAASPDNPEFKSLINELSHKAWHTGSKARRLRRRVFDLQTVLIQAAKTLQKQRLDQRILRLVAGGNRAMTVSELHDAVEKDHEDVASAITTLRFALGSRAVFIVREGNTRQDVQDALKAMARRGHVRRLGLPFARARWKFRPHARQICSRP
ncbi:hypothetical protein [Sphingomonas sp. 3-13AW]|uniref:hypothetical protein n=1 Tax=Sphingomonas sp. 3-13AW TaxID=3050450 RepID=UPI003BB647EC